MNLRICSYNIHQCIGTDNIQDYNRIVNVIKSINSDIVVLQEVQALKSGGVHLLQLLKKQLHYRVIPGPTINRSDSTYGNVILLKSTKFRKKLINISVPDREPRGAIYIEGTLHQKHIQIIGTHLGLSPSERRFQVQSILKVFQRKGPADLRILCGDINEWFIWGRPLRWLHHIFKKPPCPVTFPTRCPILSLDRIWVNPRHSLKSIFAYKTKLTKSASDHFPIVAEIEI